MKQLPNPPSRFWQRLIPVFANPTGLAIDRLLMRVFNRSLMGAIFMRAAGYAVRPHLLLTTVHWRNGARRTVVLPYTRHGDAWLVVGSNGGRRKDPVWVSNLRANPTVWMRIDRKWHYSRGRVLQGEKRAAAWAAANADGGYDNYTRISKYRRLPLVELTVVDDAKPDFDPLPAHSSGANRHE